MADDGADHPQRIETFARYTFNCVPWFREFEHQLFGLARPIGIFACAHVSVSTPAFRAEVGDGGTRLPRAPVQRGRGAGRELRAIF